MRNGSICQFNYCPRRHKNIYLFICTKYPQNSCLLVFDMVFGKSIINVGFLTGITKEFLTHLYYGVVV